MHMLMHLLETQESRPAFAPGTHRQAGTDGAFAALLAALQQLSDGEGIDPELLASLDAPNGSETGGHLFARLFAQPIPLDTATGVATDPIAEDDGETENLSVPAPVASEEETGEAPDGKVAATAEKKETGTTPVPLDKDVPRTAAQAPAQTTSTPATMAGKGAETPVAGGAPEAAQAALLRSEAHYARVENRARAAEEKAVSTGQGVKSAVTGETAADDGLGETLKLRFGAASTARALAGGWQALTQLQPELAGTANQSGAHAPAMLSVAHGSTATGAPAETGPTSQPAPAEPPTLARTEQLGSDLVRTVRYLAGREESSITLKLVPSNLGELHVEVLRRGEEVSIRLTSSQAKVREILETQAHVLREQITRDGTVVQRVEISAGLSQDGNGSGTSRETGQQPQQQQPNQPWTPQRRHQPEQDRAPTAPQFQEPGMPAGRGALNVMA